MKYRTATDGEWIQPKHRGFRMACCDCGLVHVMYFLIVKGRVRFIAFRDSRATAARRRGAR